MVYFLSTFSGNPVTDKGLPDAPGKVGKPLDIGEIQRLSVLTDEEEPVAAPGDVAADLADALDRDADIRGMAIARHVLDGDAVPPRVLERDDADRRFQAIGAGADTAEVGKRDRNADRPVTTHADGAHVVEVDHAGDTGRINRLTQDGPNDHIGAARLVDDRGAKPVEALAQDSPPLGHAA